MDLQQDYQMKKLQSCQVRLPKTSGYKRNENVFESSRAFLFSQDISIFKAKKEKYETYGLQKWKV